MQKKRSLNKNMMTVSVRGTVYRNAHEAAKALGVALITVYAAVTNGRADKIGLGRGSHSKEKFKKGIPGQSKPYEILGREFASMAEASRFIGHHDDYIKRTNRVIGPEKTRTLVEQKYLAIAMKQAAAKEREAWKKLNEHQSFDIENHHLGLHSRSGTRDILTRS